MTVRELTLHLLDEYENEGKYVNLSLSSHIADGLSKEDRGFLTALLYSTVEKKLYYDYCISSLAKRSTEKIDSHTLNILRLGACQIIDFSSIPDFACVNETVKLSRNRGERSFVNGILRNLVRLKEQNSLPMPEKERNIARFLSIKYSFPLKLTKHFINTIGESETEELFSVFNSEFPTDITVNTQKISRDELLKLLQSQNIKAEKSKISNYSIRVYGSFNPKKVKGFDEGYFFVQDSACALSGEVLGTQKGDRVIDVCSCPGGKAFIASILTGNDGKVYAYDIHESKLSLIQSGASRLSLKNIIVGEVDATVGNKELFNQFDRVICDVPCSGLGVLGKKPDLRYKDFDCADELSKLQLEILETSSSYCKVGGVLLYSTCTLNKEENENNVSRFLDRHRDFSLCDFKVGDVTSKNGMYTTYPHIDNCDGFFIAKLKKTGNFNND